MFKIKINSSLFFLVYYVDSSKNPLLFGFIIPEQHEIIFLYLSHVLVITGIKFSS